MRATTTDPTATPSHITRTRTLTEGEISKGSLFLPTAIRTDMGDAGQSWLRIVLINDGAVIADRNTEHEPGNPLLSGLDWPDAFTAGTRVHITFLRDSRALRVDIPRGDEDTPADDEITDEQAAGAEDVTAEVLGSYR